MTGPVRRKGLTVATGPTGVAVATGPTGVAVATGKTVLRRLTILLVAMVAMCALPAGATAKPAPVIAYVPVTTPASGPINIYGEEHGRGRPILMLHGLGASTHTWRHVAPALARRNRVISIDLKGFGRSDKPFDFAYSPHDHADLVIAFMRKTRLRRVSLIGHSYGGAVALLVADKLRRAGDHRLKDLVIIDAPAFPQKPTAFISFLGMPVVPYALMTLVPPELTAWLLTEPDHVLRQSYGDLSAYAKPFWDPAARHALITTSRQIVPDDVETIVSGYRRLRQPTLVVWCDKDKTVPLSTGRRLVRTLPNARLSVIKGCYHAPQDEKPRALIKRLRRFLFRR